jgi:ferredoxin
MSQELKSIAEKFLKEHTSGSVLGYRLSSVGSAQIPGWFYKMEELESMVMPSPKSFNLTGYLMDGRVKKYPVLVVADFAGVRSVNVLIQENQLKPEQVHVAAISDSSVELLSGEECSKWLESRWESHAGDAPDDFAKIDAMSVDERFAFFREEFSRCIKCYACRESCPMCYCQQCIVEKNQPQWIPVSSHELGNWHWNIVRAFHLASRCVGCGNCVTACPQGLRLDLLNYAMSRTVQEEFGYEAGKTSEGPNALQCFKEDDKEDFFR